MHIKNHAVALRPIHSSRNYNQSILRHKIPDASRPPRVPFTESLDIEFERLHTRQEEEHAAQRAQNGL